MKVSACLVTRGDVDMQPVLDSLPDEWEKILWVNGRVVGKAVWDEQNDWSIKDAHTGIPELAVYGRYAAVKYASHDLIYVQDDDVIVSDPQAIMDAWLEYCGNPEQRQAISAPVVCNMPQVFRPHYPDSGLVGFGAAFHRDAPARAFGRFFGTGPGGECYTRDLAAFNRRADNVFTTMTPRVLVDVPKADREMASDPSRMWRHPDHVGERDRMIELARKVRDA